MNFYFNYFASIGREQVNYTLYTFFVCLFLKKVDSFPEKVKLCFSSSLLGIIQANLILLSLRSSVKKIFGGMRDSVT